MGFPGGSAVKNLPANAGVTDTWIRSLSQENLLEEDMATHSSNLAWEIPWAKEPGRLHTVHGAAQVGHDLTTKPPPPPPMHEEKMQSPGLI